MGLREPRRALRGRRKDRDQRGARRGHLHLRARLLPPMTRRRRRRVRVCPSNHLRVALRVGYRGRWQTTTTTRGIISAESGSDGSYDVEHLETILGIRGSVSRTAAFRRHISDAVRRRRSHAASSDSADSDARRSGHQIDAHLSVGGKLSGSVADSHGNTITESNICVDAASKYGAGSTDEHPLETTATRQPKKPGNT